MTVTRGAIASAMAQLIAVREDLMVDECTVARPADLPATPDLDPATGMPVAPAATTPVYAGPCATADPSSALQGHRTVNDESGIPNTRVLRLPINSPALRPGDVFTVTASRFAPSLVSDTFVVLGEEERSYGTYRRYMLRGSSWLPT